MKYIKVPVKVARKNIEKSLKMIKIMQYFFIILLILFLLGPLINTLLSVEGPPILVLSVSLIIMLLLSPFYLFPIIVFIIGIISLERQKKRMLKMLKKMK